MPKKDMNTINLIYAGYAKEGIGFEKRGIRMFTESRVSRQDFNSARSNGLKVFLEQLEREKQKPQKDKKES